MSRETKIDNQETISNLATESFRDHVLKVKQDEGPARMWYCGRPGTGMYHFYIIAADRTLIIYGDVVDCILHMYDSDPIAWLRGAIKSKQYVIEKICNKRREFVSGEATKLLDDEVRLAEDYGSIDEITRANQFIEKVKEYWNGDDEQTFCEAYVDAGGEAEDLCSVYDWDSDVYWAYECLKKFVELYEVNLP